jgi:hypothetical protein
MSHYPVFCTGCGANTVSAAYYASGDAEYLGNCNATAAANFDHGHGIFANTSTTSGGSGSSAGNGTKETADKKKKKPKGLSGTGASDNLITDYAPLFEKCGLDTFIHYTWILIHYTTYTAGMG